MEILDLYDKDGNKLNKTIVRGNKDIKDNEYFKITLVWLKSNDKFLIQKTSALKGSEFAVSGGHVPTGYTSREQAVVEMKEELGLSLDKDRLEFLGSFTLKYAIFDVYLYEDDSLEDYNFTLQESEVEYVKWLTKMEIEELIFSNQFRPSSAIQFYEYITKKIN